MKYVSVLNVSRVFISCTNIIKIKELNHQDILNYESALLWWIYNSIYITIGIQKCVQGQFQHKIQ